jgi:hypothetical protein
MQALCLPLEVPMFEMVHFGPGGLSADVADDGPAGEVTGSEPVIEMVHFENRRMYRDTLLRLMPSSWAILRWERPF